MPRSNPKKKAAPAAAWARLLALLPDDELLLAGAAAVLSAARAPCVQGVGRARARQRRQPERSIVCVTKVHPKRRVGAQVFPNKRHSRQPLRTLPRRATYYSWRCRDSCLGVFYVCVCVHVCIRMCICSGGGGGTTPFTTKLQSVRRRHQEMPPTLSFERKNNHPPPSRRTNTGAPRYEAPAPDSSRTSRWWVLLSRYALCAAAGVRVQSDRRAGRRATAAGRRPRISRGPWGRPQELRRRTTRRRSCASARCRCASAPRRRGGRSGRRGRSSSRRRRACASA